MTKEYKHISVLLKESIDGLNLSQNKNIIDCTLGGAGHSEEILKQTAPNGQLIGFDLDQASIQNAEIKLRKYKNRISLINDNFKNIKERVGEIEKDIRIDGILLDLGMSSYELDDEKRGFSFMGDQPLNMSFDGSKRGDAEYIINNYSVIDLTRIMRDYGDERDSYKIANDISSYRKEKEIKTTKELVYIICKAKNSLSYLEGKDKWRYKAHPATQVFQAIRIEVNKEIENLEKVLKDGLDILASGGRMCVITFHSLEDRIVKNYFRQESSDCICDSEIPVCRCNHKRVIKIINKKPIIPSEQEINNNVRSRSAKLRIIEKI